MDQSCNCFFLSVVYIDDSYFQSNDYEYCFSNVLNKQNFQISWIHNFPRQIQTHTNSHCVKSVLIRSYSCPYFSEFGLNTYRDLETSEAKVLHQSNGKYDNSIQFGGMGNFQPEFELYQVFMHNSYAKLI